jgi:ATP-binding cassette subfamily F protein uup
MTLQVLEEFLQEFQGCLMVITHDRYFMDKLVDHLFVFEGEGKILDFNGRYDDYRASLKIESTAGGKVEKTIKKETAPVIEKAKEKLSYKEKLEFEQLEKELPKLEELKSEMALKLNETMTDHEELMKLTQKLGDLTTEIDAKTDRWLALAEFV